MVFLQFNEKTKTGKLILDYAQKLNSAGEVVVHHKKKLDELEFIQQLDKTKRIKSISYKTKNAEVVAVNNKRKLPFKPLTDKEVALGIGRKITEEEWHEYLNRPEKGKDISIGGLDKKIFAKYGYQPKAKK